MQVGSRSMRFPIACVALLAATLSPRFAPAEELCDTDICFYVPPPPSGPGCQSCIPAGNPTVLISGVVADVYGTPIQGATVYWDYEQVTSNELGAFTIKVWTNHPVSLTARRDRFAYQTITNNAPSMTWSPQFRLRYELIGMSFLSAENSNPAAVNDDMQVITLRAYSTAPVTGTAMFVQFGPDQMFGLSFDTSFNNAPGWSRWSTTYLVPDGTVDGRYPFKTCALSGWGGTCDASTNVVLGRDDSGSFIVDRVAPSFVSSDPAPFANFANVASASEVSLAFTDPLAGLASQGHTVTLDGVAVQPTIQGGTLRLDDLTLSPGVHTISATVLDRAGNAETKHLLFTIVQVSGASSSATLRERSLDVNPDGLSSPSTITFAASPVDVASDVIDINATTRVGHSIITRSAMFSDAAVLFRNPQGEQQSVAVPAFGVEAARSIGALSPSADLLRAEIDPSTVAAPDIVIDVPAGFGSQGSTATLLTRSAALGSPTYDGELFGNAWAETVRISGEVGVCLAGDGVDQIFECGAGQKVFAYYQDVDEGIIVTQLASRTAPPEDSSDDGTVRQRCIGSGCRDVSDWRYVRGGFSVSCPILKVQSGDFNLCDGLPTVSAEKSAYLAVINLELHREDDASGGLQFPVWQQNHATVPVNANDEPRCPGQSGTFRGRNYRLVTNVIANDGSTGQVVAGTREGVSHVYLGRFTGNYADGTPDADFSYQLSNDSNEGGRSVPLVTVAGGYILPAVGSRIAADGQQASVPSASSNGWQHGPDDLRHLLIPDGLQQRVQIMMGVEYRRSQASNAGYNLTASLAFQAVIDLSGCG